MADYGDLEIGAEQVGDIGEDTGLDNYDYDYDDGPVASDVYLLNDVVKKFIIYFHRNLVDQNTAEVHNIYENHYSAITEKYFKTCEWPSVEAIAPLVGDDTLFLILYKELFYRHIYANLQPTLEHRFESYKNYCDMFKLLINENKEPIPLDLPNQWLWDIVDEFIYQFQAFCDYRAQLQNKSDEEMEILQANPQIWNVHSVVNVLHHLIETSRINEQLVAFKSSRDVAAVAGPFGVRSLYKMLGYFSIIGMCRVHVLLGDYHLALKTMENVEVNNKNMSSRVVACQISAYYYVGFCYLMMRRYKDAVRTFASILQYIARLTQYQTRTQHHELVRAERIFSLLAVAITLSPQIIDETVLGGLRERCSGKISRMQLEDMDAFEEIFQFASPKFISPCPYIWDNLDDKTNHDREPYQHQLRMFLNEVQQQLLLPTVRSYLKLYTSMEVSKMARFLELDVGDFRSQLLSFKHKTRNMVWQEGSPLSGEMKTSSDMDFFINGNMIHIADSVVQHSCENFFVQQISKYEDLCQH